MVAPCLLLSPLYQLEFHTELKSTAGCSHKEKTYDFLVAASSLSVPNVSVALKSVSCFIEKEACGILDTSFRSIMKRDVDTRMFRAATSCGEVAPPCAK